MMRIVGAKPRGRLIRPDTLKAIREATVGYVRVHHRLPDAVESYAQRAAEWLPVSREILVPGGETSRVGLLLDGLPEATERAWLRRDLEHWALRFAALCGGRDFHAGLVEDGTEAEGQGARERMKMVLTYAGSGVEFRAPGATKTLLGTPGDTVLLKGQRLTREAPLRRTPPGPRLRRMAFYFVDLGV